MLGCARLMQGHASWILCRSRWIMMPGRALGAGPRALDAGQCCFIESRPLNLVPAATRWRAVRMTGSGQLAAGSLPGTVTLTVARPLTAPAAPGADGSVASQSDRDASQAAAARRPAGLACNGYRLSQSWPGVPAAA